MTAQLPELRIFKPVRKHSQRLMLAHLARCGHPFAEYFFGIVLLVSNHHERHAIIDLCEADLTGLSCLGLKWWWHWDFASGGTACRRSRPSLPYRRDGLALGLCRIGVGRKSAIAAPRVVPADSRNAATVFLASV